jgi:DCN1-like protein 1/2
MWQLLLSGKHAWPLLDEWVEFLTKYHANRAISKDTWNQLYDFIKVSWL